MPATAAGLRRRFVLLTGLRWLPTGFVAPLLVLLPLSRGLTLAQVGLAFACYGGTTAVLELPTGGLADALGRRPVLVLSSAMHLAFFALMLVADGLPLWIVVATLGGVARALDSGPLEAWYVDETRRLDPAADIFHGLSRAAAIEGAGLALAAVAGGLLPVAFGGNLNAAVTAALAAQGLHLVAVSTLMTEHRQAHRGALATAFGGVPAVIRGGAALGLGPGPVRLLLGGSLVWGITLVGVEVLWQPRFTDLLGGRSDTGPLGFLLAGAFLAAAVGSAAAPRLARLVGGGTSRSALACTLAQATAYVGLAAAGHIALAAPAFLAVYLLNGARSPFHHELLHEHVSAERRSTMLSANSLTLQGGSFVSSLTLPALATAAGIPWAWALGAGVLAASALLYLPIPDRPTPVVRRLEPEPVPVG
ncbi:MAG: MFS transporter [Acidimicrobiales bacterium]